MSGTLSEQPQLSAATVNIRFPDASVKPAGQEKPAESLRRGTSAPASRAEGGRLQGTGQQRTHTPDRGQSHARPERSMASAKPTSNWIPISEKHGSFQRHHGDNHSGQQAATSPSSLGNSTAARKGDTGIKAHGYEVHGSTNWSWATGSPAQSLLADLQTAAASLGAGGYQDPVQMESIQKEISAQALSLVSLVSQATNAAVKTGQNPTEAQKFQRSVLQAVGGLTACDPPARATSAKPAAAYLPPSPIVRPLTAAAAAPQPTNPSPDAALLSSIAPLPRPKTSPAGGAPPPPDTSDILRIEHLPEWQATVAAWNSQVPGGQPQQAGCSSDKVKQKPGEKIAPQARWKAAGSRISHMITSGEAAALSAADMQNSADADTPTLDSLETSTDDVDQLLEGAEEETRSHGYGIRTAVVAGFEVTNPLRRIDDLLERARSDLVAMAAAESASATAKEVKREDQGAVDAAAARGPPKAEDVAAMLAQVAEASAVVRGDVLARLQKERSRNSELLEDKKRLLKEVYDQGAHLHHVETVLTASKGRNKGLIDQAEAAKARKLTCEKRMHGMEAHVAELEEKLSKYRGKLDSQLKEHMRVWQGKVEAFDALQAQHAQLQEDHSATVKEAHAKRKLAEELQQELDDVKIVAATSGDREKALRAEVRRLKDEVCAFKDLRTAQDATAVSGKAREKDLRAALADRDLNILALQRQLSSSQQEAGEERKAKEIAQADVKKQQAQVRTLKSHLEVAQSSARKHASANERLLEEADSARAERDEARSTVSTLMDESTTATVALEKSQKKQKLLEARSAAATKRCDALEHRSKQQAAALDEARSKRKAAEASVVEADERCDALAGRLIAAEAAAADARDVASRIIQARDLLHDEADAAREEAATLRSELKDSREKVRGTEVEALRTRNELKTALMSVNELTNEKMSLTQLLQKVLENIDRLRVENEEFVAQIATQKEEISQLEDDKAALNAEVQRLLPYELEVPKLQEQQAELLERNRLLEQLREDLSARLAKQQDALNDLRAAGDKLVALAGATASECAAAQQTSHDAQLAALEHISQVREAMTAVVHASLVLPGTVLGALASNSTEETSGESGQPQSDEVAADGDPAEAGSTTGSAEGGKENQEGSDPSNPPVSLPEGFDVALVSDILAQEKAKKDLKTAEDVARVAAAFDGLRCTLADTCVAAHSRAITAAATAEEHSKLLLKLNTALAAASSVMDAQHEPTMQSARYLAAMVESNTVLGSGLHSLCSKWLQTSLVAPNTATDASTRRYSSTEHPPTPGEAPGAPPGPPQPQASTAAQHVAVRVPCGQLEGQDDSVPPDEQEILPAGQVPLSEKQLQPGRELRDISGVVGQLLLNRENLTANAFMGGQEMPQARRLVLSVEAEQLPLQDERAAANGYAVLVAREEALAAQARAASRREAGALAAAAAAVKEFAAARQELVRLHEAAESMKVERDEAKTSADNAQQQRLLIEHYSKVLAERLIRQQAAVNAAAAATGRSLECTSIATQTSESVLCGAAPQRGAYHAPQSEVEGGEMAAALKSRDSAAFQMLLDALHELPRQWLLALPPRLLRVLAGEGFNVEDRPAAPPAPPPAPSQAIIEPQPSPEASTEPQAPQNPWGNMHASPGRLRVNRKAELTISAQPTARSRALQTNQSNEEDAIAAAAAACAATNSSSSTVPESLNLAASALDTQDDQAHLGNSNSCPQEAAGDQGTEQPQHVERSESMAVEQCLLEDEHFGGSCDVGMSLLLQQQSPSDTATINPEDEALLAHHHIDPSSGEPLPTDALEQGTSVGDNSTENGGSHHQLALGDGTVHEDGRLLDEVVLSQQAAEISSDTPACSGHPSDDVHASAPNALEEASMQRDGSLCNEGSDVMEYTKLEGVGGIEQGGVTHSQGVETSGSSTPRGEEALEDNETPQMLRMTIKKSVTFCASARRPDAPAAVQPAALSAQPAHPSPPPGTNIIQPPATVGASPLLRTHVPPNQGSKRSYPLSPSAANSSTSSPGSQHHSARPDERSFTGLELAESSHRVRLPQLPAIVNSLPVASPHRPAHAAAAARPASALAAAFVGGSTAAGRGPARVQQELPPQEEAVPAMARLVQSARRAVAPRADLAERARCIRDDMRHGVWASEQPGVRSRQARLAAAVDSDIRRAGRGGASALPARAPQHPQAASATEATAQEAASSEAPEASPAHESHELRVLVGRTLSRHLSATSRAPAPAIVQRFLSNKTTMRNAAVVIGTTENSELATCATPARHIMQQSVYGRSVPQLADESLSSPAPADEEPNATDEGLEAMHQQRHRSLQRAVLKDIPANALVPPVAAAATTALAAAPGGAAALCAIQRGAVLQTLKEAGVQLGVLVSSCNVQRDDRTESGHAGSGKSPADTHVISRQGRVALDILLLDVCKTLGCSTIPLLYIRPDAVARAHFLALPKDSRCVSSELDLELPMTWSLHPTFVLTSEVLELLDREELRALFGSLLAFSLAPGGCGFDVAASHSLVPELSNPLLDAIGAAINPSGPPEPQYDRRSSRGCMRSGTAPTRRASASPSRMHGAAPRLSTAATAHPHALQTVTLAAAATAAALQDLTPGLLSTIGMGREERGWKARAGWGGGGLEAMTRRAVPLLRMAADRGAMLVSQDLSVVERMIVKMECGSASLIRHVSLPSLRSAAQHLLKSSTATHTLGMHLISQRSQASGRSARASTAGHRRQSALRSAPHDNRGPSVSGRRSSLHFRDAEIEPPAEESNRAEALQVWAQKLAAGDVTVLRLAALQRWVASGEYESLLERCRGSF